MMLQCPEIFTLLPNDNGEEIDRERSLAFLNEIHNAFSNGKQIEIDLSHTKIAYAESTLILFAIVFNIRKRQKRSQIRIIYPDYFKNPGGFQYFISTGLHYALNVTTDEDVEQLRINNNFYQSGTAEIYPEMLKSIWENISREDITSEQKYLLQQGVNEAILNIRTHAYINKRTLQNKIGKGRWWQCSWFQQSKRQFVFLIYDMGSGILGTYPNPNNLPRTELLKEAMTNGHSRYVSQKRGKGSEDIKKVISNNIAKEILTIYTQELIYQYLYIDNKEHISSISLSPTHQVQGTLVCWTLTLEKE